MRNIIGQDKKNGNDIEENCTISDNKRVITFLVFLHLALKLGHLATLVMRNIIGLDRKPRRNDIRDNCPISDNKRVKAFLVYLHLALKLGHLATR